MPHRPMLRSPSLFSVGDTSASSLHRRDGYIPTSPTLVRAAPPEVLRAPHDAALTLNAPPSIDKWLVAPAPICAVLDAIQGTASIEVDECTICCGPNPVWACPCHDERLCTTCVAQLVTGMSVGPLPCPGCRTHTVPSFTVERFVTPVLYAHYTSRRAAPLRASAIEWLQSASQALLHRHSAALTTLPFPVLTVPIPLPLVDAESAHEYQLLRELNTAVWSAAALRLSQFERFTRDGDTTAIQNALTQIADDSVAIACDDAKMCPRCHFGPVLLAGCTDLTTHHLEKQWSNCCRRCGFFAVSANRWSTWDHVNRLSLPDGEAAENDVSRLAQATALSERDAVNLLRSADGDLDCACLIATGGS